MLDLVSATPSIATQSTGLLMGMSLVLLVFSHKIKYMKTLNFDLMMALEEKLNDQSYYN